MISCYVYNPVGNGGQVVPRIGALSAGSGVAAKLTEEIFDSLSRRSTLQVAKAGTDEHRKLEKLANPSPKKPKPAAKEEVK